jgi:hypothetical protein
MQSLIRVGLCLALAASLPAQESQPDFQKELDDLWRSHAKAFREAEVRKKTAAGADERRKIDLELEEQFAPKFRDLARRARGTPAAFDAHYRLFLVTSSERPNEEVIAEVLKEHRDSPDLARFASLLGSRGEHEAAQKALAQIARDSPLAQVRATALFASVQHKLEKELDAPTTQVLERVAKEFAETQAGKEARTILKLVVGREAPDFSGEDAHGTPVRLRDQRGKVVILDFWGYW